MRIFIFLIFLQFSSLSFGDDCHQSLVPSLAKEHSSGDVASYLSSLKNTILFSSSDVKGSYCHYKKWYEDRMSSRRFSSRVLAILIIVLGASLPLIAIMDRVFKEQKFWVAFIGAAIVIGQGFLQTFQYEESWRNYTVAKLELESAHRQWQKRVIDSSYKSDGIAATQKATDDFSSLVSKIVIKETTGFFDSLSESVKGLREKKVDS